MTTMKLTDLTPDIVKALYRKHGLKPCSGRAKVVNGTCCALGVVAIELGRPVVDPETSYPDHFVDLFSQPSEAMRFALGFDQGFRNPEIKNPRTDIAIEIVGYEIGQAMAKWDGK